VGTWCTVRVLGPEGIGRVAWPVSGPGRPGLAVVEALARAQVDARRRGGCVVVTDLCDDLGRLLDLTGLFRQVGGQPEGGEDPFGVEEAVEPGDASR